MAKFMTLEGLQYLWTQLKDKLSGKVDKEAGKGLSSNDFKDEYKNKLENIEDGANHYAHPNSGARGGTYRAVTVNEQGHVTAGINPTTLSGYGITDAASKSHTHVSEDITALDASKLTGTIDIERLPQGALERCVIVENDSDRFALTTGSVQRGDTVKVVTTKSMYFVIDDTKLNSEAGYEVYTAGSATSVPWSGITGKPQTYPPAFHTHTKEQITDLDISEITNAEIDSVLNS